MKYLLMAVSIMFSVINAGLLRSFANKTKNNKYSPFVFNAGVSVVWMIILAIWLFISGDCDISITGVIYGAVYGVILGLFLLFKMQATAEGPVSLTTLIGSCSFIIATGFSIFYARESVSIFQLIGMGLLLVSLILCINPKKSGEKLTKKWFFNCFMFFFIGGLVGILYKLFGKSDASEQVNTMILIASVVSGTFFIFGGLIEAKKTNKKLEKPNNLVLTYMLLCGIAGCVYIRLNVSLSSVIPGAIFFPVSNGGMVILSTVVGKLIFKEKLKRVQIIGILIGLIAIVINGCGDVLWSMIAS